MKRKMIKILLSLLTAACYYFVFSLPMWNFTFKAPQYPEGLKLDIYLTKTTGDVREIEIINHYVGMQKLDDAAKTEKAMIPYILITLSVLSLIIGLSSNKFLIRFLSLPIVGFPIAFVILFFYWLYKFGHDLNPAAPVELEPFTPNILGKGIIGQFETFAQPSIGFYLICLAALLTLIQVYFITKTKKDVISHQKKNKYREPEEV